MATATVAAVAAERTTASGVRSGTTIVKGSETNNSKCGVPEPVFACC